MAKQVSALKSIVILTGAGVSAESGLGTFRDKDGLWTKYDLSEVATPEAFRRDPEKVLGFYNARRENLIDAKPNEAHRSLARLEAAAVEAGTDFLLVTQNVDPLHERAGSKRLLHMHGLLAEDRCQFCGLTRANPGPLEVDEACEGCGRSGGLRPNVVWFGEIPLHMEEIYDRLAAASLFLSIGTSGTVYPAAGFVVEALRAGAHTVELSLDPGEGASYFAEKIYGPATQTVPAYVDRLIENGLKAPPRKG